MLNSNSLEPSYFASRVVAVFTDLREKIKYQGGGSLPQYCQNRFLQCALETLIDAVLEGYAKNKRVKQKEIKSQTEFDLAYLGFELNAIISKTEKCKAIERINNFVRIMNTKGKENVLKTLFGTKEWTYNTICSIIKNHTILEKENTKDILIAFQVF